MSLLTLVCAALEEVGELEESEIPLRSRSKGEVDLKTGSSCLLGPIREEIFQLLRIKMTSQSRNLFKRNL